MKQAARNLTDCDDGFFRNTGYVLMDRDTNFSEAFIRTLHHGGVEAVRLPARSPNPNAHMERFFRRANVLME
jgi:hypothetical protein